LKEVLRYERLYLRKAVNMDIKVKKADEAQKKEMASKPVKKHYFFK